MKKETRITFIDENNDCHAVRLPWEEVVITVSRSTVTVDLHQRWSDLVPALPVAGMTGWEIVVTDSEAGNTYSGTIHEISPFGVTLQKE